MEIISWLATGERGMSSETMAFTALGQKCEVHHPLDPADLNRCIKLVRSCPSVKERFNDIACLNAEWNTIINHWDELEKMFIDEVGYDWSKSDSAPNTCRRMKELGL